MCHLIPFPQPLPLRLPTIEGNVDYLEFERQLRRIDSLLLASRVETQFITASVNHWRAKKQPETSNITPRQQLKFQDHSRRALRCNIVRTLLQLGYRKLAVRSGRQPPLAMVLRLEPTGQSNGAQQKHLAALRDLAARRTDASVH